MAYYPCCRTAVSGYTDGSVSAPVPVVRGEWDNLPEVIQSWVRFKIALCQPDALHIMDGSEEEDAMVIKKSIFEQVNDMTHFYPPPNTLNPT